MENKMVETVDSGEGDKVEKKKVKEEKEFVEQQEHIEKNDKEEEYIRRYTLDTLGKPSDFIKVDVKLLFKNRYRVNIIVNKSPVGQTISDSFYVVSKLDGLVYSPEIKNKY